MWIAAKSYSDPGFVVAIDEILIVRQGVYSELWLASVNFTGVADEIQNETSVSQLNN